MTDEQIENWFTFHTDCPPEGFIAIRSAAKQLAKAIAEHTPSCADQSAAIRKVREAVFTANAAIACKGK